MHVHAYTHIFRQIAAIVQHWRRLSKTSWRPQTTNSNPKSLAKQMSKHRALSGPPFLVCKVVFTHEFMHVM